MNMRKPGTAEQMAAVMALPQIVKALGQKRTVNEFFPYLIETPSFSEKIWLEILNQIPKIQLNKYKNDDLRDILGNILQITKFESHQIREASVNAIYSIFTTLSPNQVSSILVPQIGSMLKSPLATTRGTAISMFAKMAGDLPETVRSTLFSQIIELESDKTPLVRQSLSSSASKITPYLNANEKEQLLQVMMSYAKDTCISVAMPVTDFFVSFVASTGRVNEALECGEELTIHPNWKVRSYFLSKIHEIFNSNTSADDIFNFISQSLNDSDPDVASSAAGQISFYLGIPGADLEHARNAIDAAFEDNRPAVVSAGVRSLPAFVFKTNDIEYASEKLSNLVKMNNSEMSLAALDALSQSSIPDDVTTSCVLEMLKSKEWREREPVVRKLPELLLRASPGVVNVVKTILFDDACAVRSAALDTVTLIAKKLGKDWALNDFVKILNEGAQSDDYQIRQTVAIAAIDLGIEDSPQAEAVMKKLASDEITNVRYVIAKRLPRGSKLLELFKDDTDPDVRDVCQ